MDPDEIDKALATVLLDAPLLVPLVFPNQEEDPPRPFLYYQHFVVDRTDSTLDGSAETETGFITITVVVKKGTFTSGAKKLAHTVMGLYSYTKALTFPGGLITINEPPVTQRGFRDGADWRLPVRVSYEAEKTV